MLYAGCEIRQPIVKHEVLLTANDARQPGVRVWTEAVVSCCHSRHMVVTDALLLLLECRD